MTFVRRSPTLQDPSGNWHKGPLSWKGSFSFSSSWTPLRISDGYFMMRPCARRSPLLLLWNTGEDLDAPPPRLGVGWLRGRPAPRVPVVVRVLVRARLPGLLRLWNDPAPVADRRKSEAPVSLGRGTGARRCNQVAARPQLPEEALTNAALQKTVPAWVALWREAGRARCLATLPGETGTFPVMWVDTLVRARMRAKETLRIGGGTLLLSLMLPGDPWFGPTVAPDA